MDFFLIMKYRRYPDVQYHIQSAWLYMLHINIAKNVGMELLQILEGTNGKFKSVLKAIWPYSVTLVNHIKLRS